MRGKWKRKGAGRKREAEGRVQGEGGRGSLERTLKATLHWGAGVTQFQMQFVARNK